MSGNIFWMVSNNFGDALNPYIYEKITGKVPTLIPKDSPESKLIMIGSILNHANESSIVWGAGLARLTDTVNPKCDIRAVRGPISRQIALGCGASCPEIYGDPALLLPRFYPANRTDEFILGIIPHVVDYDAVVRAYGNYEQVRIIDLRDDTEDVIDDIIECQNIISSSLHGLIAADTYGIPSYWVEFSDKVLGDYTKFYDYFESVGIKKYHPIRIMPGRDRLESFDFRLFEPVDLQIDLDLLMSAFPVDTEGAS
jgi:pyruvyltransferase